MLNDWLAGRLDGLRTAIDMMEDGQDISHIRACLNDEMSDCHARMYVYNGREYE